MRYPFSQNSVGVMGESIGFDWTAMIGSALIQIDGRLRPNPIKQAGSGEAHYV
jgi:hypothetical protein